MVEASGRAFVIRPFGVKPSNNNEEIDFEDVHEKLIGPALRKIGLSGGTAGEFMHQGVIHEDMFREIVSADVVIADISMHNANAFYELGIRHALRDRFTVMIRADKHTDNHVFDLKPERYLRYSLDKPEDSIDLLVDVISATIKSEKPDSPVYRLLPGMSPVDLTSIVVVPSVFREEVKQAAVKGVFDELLQLKGRALKEPWEKEGLRLIARALSQKAYHEAAADAWEQLREYGMFDVEANQKLATHYQRLSRFTESEQAAARCLEVLGSRDWDKAEAHALIASNYKTQWRNSFSEVETIAERQKSALTDVSLQKSYDSYHRGFECHRSHYYSGLNSVSMLKVQIELANKHFEKWVYLFETESKAEFELTERIEHVKKLEAGTELAISSSINNYDDDWARISYADLLLLSSEEPKRVSVAYSQCKVAIKDFNADAVLNQLTLYQSLDLFEDNVSAAIEVVNR